MAQSIQLIETEIVVLKASIQAVEKEIQQVNVAINEAEKHVLEDDKVHFWEPKLSSLRQDKVFLLKKEENLHKEMVVLEQSRLATIQSQGSEFGFFNIDGEEDQESSPRARHSTWQAGHIAMADQANINAKTGNNSSLPTIESSPSIMTKVTEDELINQDPNATLQGQNRRPHMGNLKKNDSFKRVDSYNVFGVAIDDDEDSNTNIPTLPPNVTRDVSESTTSETSEQGTSAGGIAGVGKFLHEFFDASESLLLAQGNNPGSQSPARSRSNKKAPGVGGGPVDRPPTLQPAVSNHDFSVFGADMYNDSDNEK
mmetsp:Transcript_26334/g.44446  ORF Transcript_26334/g.44446 Transcript_26334/m.44446 type:complete len:312 (+) Transcript_26334:75-1010(+)